MNCSKQKMNILVIDYISLRGHRNFNKIHIESLLRLGHSLHLVGREGQFDNIEQSSNVRITNIPDWMFKHHAIGQLTERINGIIRLWWIKFYVKPKRYDDTIFLVYDILSLFFYRDVCKTYLVNHNNVSQLLNRVKYWLTKHLPSNYTHVTLNEEMELRLKELLPSREVKMVPHGICPPSDLISRPPFVSDKQQFLFCPINRNYDISFVKRLFESRELVDFLNANDIVLYLKESMPVSVERDKVIKIEDRIDLSFYNYLLKECVVVILPYSEQFKYRSSGILFECVARNKPILANDIEAMTIYKEKVEMRLFNDTIGLVDGIKHYIDNPEVLNNIELFNPDSYWSNVIGY